MKTQFPTALLFFLICWSAGAQPKPQIEIECESLTGEIYEVSTRLEGYDPRDSMDQPAQVKIGPRHHSGSLVQSLVDPYGKRLLLEVLIPENRTPTTDRVLGIMASWIGESGDFVYASGVLVDSVYHHDTGRVQEGPQIKARCSLNGLSL